MGRGGGRSEGLKGQSSGTEGLQGGARSGTHGRAGSSGSHGKAWDSGRHGLLYPLNCHGAPSPGTASEAVAPAPALASTAEPYYPQKNIPWGK